MQRLAPARQPIAGFMQPDAPDRQPDGRFMQQALGSMRDPAVPQPDVYAAQKFNRYNRLIMQSKLLAVVQSELAQ